MIKKCGRRAASLLIGLLLCSLSCLPGVPAQDGPSDSDVIEQYIREYQKELDSGVEDPDSLTEEDAAGKSTVVTVEPAVDPNGPPFAQPPDSAEVSEEIPSADHSEETPEVVKESEPCKCVKYFLCDIDNGTVIDNGDVFGLIDIRLGTKSPCSHYLDICCKTTKPEIKPDLVKVNAQHEICGNRNTGGVGFRITGALDGETQFGEFPWMAAVVRQESQGDDRPPLNIFVCGGSLIHPRVVLTAAHCVFGKPVSELKVRLGEWDTQTLDELYQHQDRFVSKIVVHEDYYMGALYNDIALLFLDQNITFAPNVDTVCLPPPDLNFDGQRCVATGWGKDSFEKEGKYQVILKKLDLPVVPRGKCESALRKTRLGPFFKLHNSFVCAGGEPGKDTCRGDGGSPLVCQLPNSKNYVQFGIVAWGIGCGGEGLPGVYVNVPKFVPWIEEKMILAQLDTKYYKDAY